MKIALGIEYDGSCYFGWQRQQNVVSVQQKAEEAISDIANEAITLFCAGRTDAGVHATGQVVHFETLAIRDINAWTLGVNAKLPHNIAVKWATHVDNEFHARFSAEARRYQYIIYNNRCRHAILHQGMTHYHQKLDDNIMNVAAQYLIGEHDFSAFRAAQCQSVSPWRNIHHITVSRYGDYLIVDIQANAFVHHMVRNIVGSLLEVGNGHYPKEWIQDLLCTKDRALAAATAKPEGLYLVEVVYPTHFQLPQTTVGILGKLKNSS